MGSQGLWDETNKEIEKLKRKALRRQSREKSILLKKVENLSFDDKISFFNAKIHYIEERLKSDIRRFELYKNLKAEIKQSKLDEQKNRA